jgi:hypothetical protein
MTPEQTFGNYSQADKACEYLTMVFSPLSVPLRSRWRNNGLSADFLGDYVTTFLPAGNGTEAAHVQTEIRHAVTYIANELLENAMKYHEHSADIPIALRLELRADHVTVSATNGVGPGQAERYRTFVELILKQGDVGDLLVRQLEDTAARRDSSTSCLGLLTMISDYGAKLGWRFEQDTTYQDIMTVTTRAVLPLKKLTGVKA